MAYDAGIKPEGAPERSLIAGGGAPSGVGANGAKRFSVQRKMAVVVRLLRGEPLELVARESNVTVAKLTDWRERALAGAETALKWGAARLTETSGCGKFHRNWRFGNGL